MSETQAESLSEQVRRKLRVTWSDVATDARIDYDIIPAARLSLAFILGLPEDFDFSQSGQENILFLALCFYLWNDAEDEFKANYAADIVQCRRKWEVAAFVEEGQASLVC